MAENIFVFDTENKLHELHQTAYDSEDLLQRLLADFPTVLSSAVGADGGLLLVQREKTVPDSEHGAGRWSLDHLFLDGNGVPVLVEVKRASDTRARREVVAQMLDYAANGVAYWPISEIIKSFHSTCEKTSVDPDETLASFLGEGDTDDFWRKAETNLRSGRIRMIFLADRIGEELRRIVEFLNEQMRPAEVLAVEVVQYLNPDGLRTLVPKLIGSTERAKSAKAITASQPAIDIDEWLSLLENEKGLAIRSITERIKKWLGQLDIEIGVTNSNDSLFGTLAKPDGKKSYPFFIRRSTGNFEISLQYLKHCRSFADDAERLKLLEEIVSMFPDAKLNSNKPNSWPAIPLPVLESEENWRAFEQLTTEIVSRIREG